MTDTNTKIAQQITGIQVGLNYATLANGGLANKTAVAALRSLIAQEGTDGTDPTRGFLDEMSPACRTFLYAHLNALHAAIVNTSP